MAYPTITHELTFLGVADPGKPNLERLILRPTQRINLAGFALAVGHPNPPGANPLFDTIFWFPLLEVAPPSWLIVYTGKGSFKQSTLPNGELTYSFHWQRPHTIFNDVHLVPILLRADGVIIGPQLRHQG